VFVLDASVAVAALLSEDRWSAASAILERLGSESAIAPGHWSLEVANVLARELRRERITVEESVRLAVEVERWGVLSDQETPLRALNRTLELAAAHRLTSYDAAYLELCLRLSLPLATFDSQLADAARQSGVTLVMQAAA